MNVARRGTAGSGGEGQFVVGSVAKTFELKSATFFLKSAQKSAIQNKIFVDLFFLEKKFCEKFLGAKKSAHLALKATNEVISCDFKILIMIIKKCRVPAGSMSGFGY